MRALVMGPGATGGYFGPRPPFADAMAEPIMIGSCRWPHPPHQRDK